MNTSQKFSITLVLLMFGCKKDFTFKKNNNYTTILKLNGYYYSKISRLNTDTLINFIFLYNNGTALFATSSTANLKDIEESFKNGTYHKNAQSYGDSWGPYKIENLNLYFERWYPQDNQPIYGNNCHILNDTTFHLYETFNMIRGKQKNKKSLDEIYHFKKFSPKPDSTNKYVK